MCSSILVQVLVQVFPEEISKKWFPHKTMVWYYAVLAQFPSTKIPQLLLEENMDESHKKELSCQDTHKLRYYEEGELIFNNKSLLDDFTRYISIAGETCFNKCWSTVMLFS